MSCRIHALALALAGLPIAACAPDGPDAYSAPLDEAVATTERVLPSTTLPPPPPPTAQPGDTVAPTTAPPPPSTVPPVEPNGEVVQVRSLDNTFRVADIDVVAGTEVWWTNNGRNDHNVLPVNDDEVWGIDTDDFTPGDEYRYVFDTPGTYLYYCSIHGTKTVGMVGSVTVTPASG